ncbi:hypothetical protein ABNavy71_142 [Acinetobacter phage AB-Navy71]|nr:hypothetical protein ABNavy71_142 [Acinetobacter phage AB-Navy71]
MSISKYVNFAKRMNEMAKQNDKHVASYENGLPRIGGYRARDAYREELKRLSKGQTSVFEDQQRENERRRRETEERDRRASANLQRQNQMLVTMCCIL